MQLISRSSFEVQTGNRNYQVILSQDSPIEEFLQVLESLHAHYSAIKEEMEKQKETEKPKE